MQRRDEISNSRLRHMRSLRLLLAGLVVSSSAFSIAQAPLRATRAHELTTSAVAPVVALAPRRPKHPASRLAPVQMGLFGLGGPEIAVIAVVVTFLLGPDKLKELAKEAGKIVPDLKEISSEALGEIKDASVEAASELKKSSGPALQALKETATPVLSDIKDVAIKEAKEVASSFTEGATSAEVPDAVAGAASADAKDAPEAKAT